MSLSSRSMFVSLHQRLWQAQSTDRALAYNVEVSADAKARTMKVIKQLAPTDYLLPIRRIATLGKDHHERLTLPGLQKGQQLLSTKLFDAYAEAQAEIRDSFFREVDSFCNVYPDIVDEAPKRLGKAFNPKDFPAVDSIRKCFDYAIRFSPVPDSGNWLLDDVDSEDLDKLRNEVENQKNSMFRDATKELFDRTAAVLERLSQQAKDYKEGEINGGVLKDVTINSVKEMAELISSMNITGDPMLEATAQEMREKFGKLEGKEMRQSVDMRTNVAAAAQRLLEKMRGAAP